MPIPSILYTSNTLTLNNLLSLNHIKVGNKFSCKTKINSFIIGTRWGLQQANLRSALCQLSSSRDIGQIVYNYKRVVQGLGCLNIKGLG